MPYFIKALKNDSELQTQVAIAIGAVAKGSQSEDTPCI